MIDTDIAVDKFEDLTDQCCCSICSESYDSVKFVPHVLECGHTICMECINKMRTNNAVKCPTCQKMTDLPDGKVLPKNYTLLSMSEVLIKSRADPKVNCKACDSKFSPSAVRICNLVGCNMYKEIICLNCALDKGHGGHVVKYDAKMDQIREELKVKVDNLCANMEGTKKSVLEKTKKLSRMAKALETRFSEVNVPPHIIGQLESLASEQEAKEYMEIVSDLADTLINGCNSLAGVLDNAIQSATQQFEDLFEDEPIDDGMEGGDATKENTAPTQN